MKRTINQYDLDSFVETEFEYHSSLNDTPRKKADQYDLKDLVEIETMLQDVLNELFARTKIVAILHKSESVTIVKSNDEYKSDIYVINSTAFAKAVHNLRHTSKQELENIFNTTVLTDTTRSLASMESYDLLNLIK